jgi:hypothetical protein
MFAGIFAAHALAADPATGYIQVCKQSGAGPVIGNFRFLVSDTNGTHPVATVTVPVGNCSAPILVAAGVVTVTEVGTNTTMHADGSIDLDTPGNQADFQKFISASATGTGKAGPTGSFDGKWTYTVTVPPSVDQSGTVTVTFTDTLITGTVEICKQTVTGSQLTGTWTYTVTGSNGFNTVSNPVPIGACTQPITVPAGYVKVVESGDNAENVTGITASHADGSDAVSPGTINLPAASVVVTVNAGDASKGTIVTFTNNSVRLKLCKVWADDAADPAKTTGYPFAFTYSGPAGPSSGPASQNLIAGTPAAPNCVLVGGPYRAGTQVVITEGIVPGTKVAGITVNPSGNNVPPGPDIPNRTVKVTLGAGETVVTFSDEHATNGTLKLCKSVSTTPPLIPAGTLFSFTLTPVAPTTGSPVGPVMVPAGSCVVVGTFAFDSTWTVTEAAAPNISVVGITAIPTFVVVLENGQPVNTNQTVLTAINPAARSTNVTIGENNITELTFTNTDPPSDGSTGGSTGGTTTGSTGGTTSGTGTTGTGGTTSNNTGGGGGGGGSSTSTGGSSTPSVTSTTAPVTTGAVIAAPSTVGTSLGLGSSTSKTSSTAAELRLKTTLAKLRTELTANKVMLKKLIAEKAAAKTLAGKHALAKRIAALQVKNLKLAAQIRILS